MVGGGGCRLARGWRRCAGSRLFGCRVRLAADADGV